MKFIVAIILTGLLAFALGGYLDWWCIALAAFLVAVVIPQRPVMAMLSGFLGLFILWGGLAFIINRNNGSFFAARMARILPLNGSIALLLFVTALVGAIVAAFAALTGSFVRAPSPVRQVEEDTPGQV